MRDFHMMTQLAAYAVAQGNAFHWYLGDHWRVANGREIPLRRFATNRLTDPQRVG